jgi:SAM-dependent methyltransferase
MTWFPRAAALLGALLALPAIAAQPALEVPTPYLPSTTVAVEELLRLADVKPGDLVVDLGSGDGRIPITAARYFGARGYGVDIDGKLVAESNENARQAGVADRVRFEQKDVFDTDVSNASVVTLYLLSGLVNRLQPKLLKEMKPGARIIAHDYPFEGWAADRTVNISKTYYLYIVPAQAAGRWRLAAQLPEGERTFDLDIKQDRQKVSGGARVQGGFLPLFDAQLTGDRLRFVLVDEQRALHFEGRVNGSLLEGNVRMGIGNAEVTRPWRATRVVGAGEEG